MKDVNVLGMCSQETRELLRPTKAARKVEDIEFQPMLYQSRMCGESRDQLCPVVSNIKKMVLRRLLWIMELSANLSQSSV